MPKQKTPKTVTLTWRDESYGAVWCSYAFRPRVEPHAGDTEALRLQRLYKRHGFTMNHNRASYIAEEGQPVALAEALAAAGYSVTHAGAVPRFFTHPGDYTESAGRVK